MDSGWILEKQLNLTMQINIVNRAAVSALFSYLFPGSIKAVGPRLPTPPSLPHPFLPSSPEVLPALTQSVGYFH